MPKTAYERKYKHVVELGSVDSSSTTCSVAAADLTVDKLKDFYRSIPDYNDINHLPSEEFYSTLKCLREKKKVMLGMAINHIDDCNGHEERHENEYTKTEEVNLPCPVRNINSNLKVNYTKYPTDERDLRKIKNKNHITKAFNHAKILSPTNTVKCLKRSPRRATVICDNVKNTVDDLNVAYNVGRTRADRPKRNHSACSISWKEENFEPKTEVDHKCEQYFERKNCPSLSSKVDAYAEEFKTRSMPSSPLRMKRNRSPLRRRRSITVPKPFKMTERDEEDRIVNELRTLRKSFSEDILHQKCDRRIFKAKPVPIESRISLYDKILEDQAMRRAITKINSEAELRAQMKPFSFTKREEKGVNSVCERATQVLPKSKKKKRFRARPVPKNLFSNYFYDKMKEDEYFRSMNNRIRAEEMLRCANYPGNMAARDRSHLSTPAAHSDLPIDPSPAVPSISSSDRRRGASPSKDRKKRENYLKEDLITTSPQPFRFNTADRAIKKMHDVVKKMYQENKSTDSVGGGGEGPRLAYSALELRATATGRSNLAALLRAEAIKRRFEMDATRRIGEQRRRAEIRHRDRFLRSKPAWHLVRNNHEEDIAMRLQTRRDEERMRREEFLHEMELMYGRVQQQPMLFERYYVPRSLTASMDSIQLSPRKVIKKLNQKNKSYHYNSPDRSRKVSINDTAEAYNGHVSEYLNRIDIDDKYSDSEVVIESINREKY